MLNVPETVKALFKADGVRKNFRVQFPNGELPDITNDNIAQESVKFTESLCTQDVLKFGLTEASVIEFETVGVANMYGMTIECGIEIDLSSLSASEIAEIAAGSWDGVYVSETDTDIGFPFFRVPYGVFRVESCPRDHQAMTHRKVQAYSANSFREEPSFFESEKLNALYSSAGGKNDVVYRPSIGKLAYSFLPQEILENDPSITKVQKTLNESTSATGNSIASGTEIYNKRLTASTGVKFTTYGTTSRVAIDFPGASRSPAYANTFDPDGLYDLVLDISSTWESTLFQEVETWLNNYGVSVPEAQKEAVFEGLRQLFPVSVLIQCTNTSKQNWFTINKSEVIYPRTPVDRACRLTVYAYKSITLDIEVTWTVSSVVQFATHRFSTSPVDSVSLYEYTGIGDVATLNIKPTSFYQDTFGIFTDSYSVLDLMNGFLEVTAQFGRIDRFSRNSFLRLSQASPEAVLPGYYSGFWWDEYDVLPIGTINAAYKDSTNTDTEIFYQFGSGASIYDMSDNDILKNLDGANETTITDLLDAYFIPHLGPIAFTPIDLDMKGLPYVEPGDYLAVTAEDGQTAYSFNMRQEISGVQVLDAHIESTSGTIIESEAGT